MRNVLYVSTALTVALFLGGITTLAYGSAESQQALQLIGAEYGIAFWGISFLVGSLAPLVLVAMPANAKNPSMVLLAGVLATLGAYTFRMVIVEAGQLPQLFY